MSFLPPPSYIMNQALTPYLNGWVTPEEQIQRLTSPLAATFVNQNRDRFHILRNSPFEQSIIESVSRSILKRSNLPEKNSEKKIHSLMDLAVEQFFDPLPLPPYLTNWYTALKKLGLGLGKIPPLPRLIHQILNSPCPIYANRKLQLKVKDTHFLTLVAQEFSSINQLEDSLNCWGAQIYSAKRNPLRFQFFWEKARLQHGNTPFPETHWVLMTKDVLPESKEKTWDEKVELVSSLRRKSYIDYEIPTLQQSFAAIMTHRIATEEVLFQAGSHQNRNTYTYTAVKEKTEGELLAIGSASFAGIFLNYFLPDDLSDVGVAALRKL